MRTEAAPEHPTMTRQEPEILRDINSGSGNSRKMILTIPSVGGNARFHFDLGKIEMKLCFFLSLTFKSYFIVLMNNLDEK